MLFEDEERGEERKRRDPILPTKPSESVKVKTTSHQTAEGLPVQSSQTLMAELASRERATDGLRTKEPNLAFKQVPEPTALEVPGLLAD